MTHAWAIFKLVLLVSVVFASALGAIEIRHVLTADTAAQPDLSRLPPVTEVTPTAAAPAVPAPLPASFRLGVPFTTQAPDGNWAKHQESCEEANLVMVDAYWKGDRSSNLNPTAAEKGIESLVAFQVRSWGSEDDLTDVRLGQLAQQADGYQFQVVPISEEGMKAAIAGGIPVVIGVTTHGLGNPHYPNFQAHHLVPPWSVPHFITLVGYDNQGFILNDPGITPGHGYHVVYDQLLFAIDNLDQQHANLNEGRVMLLIRPSA